MQPPHFAGEILYCLIVQHMDLCFADGSVRSLNVQVAEIECFFLRHAALNAVACQHGNGDDQMILQISQRVTAQLAVAFSAKGCVQQMHSVAVSRNHAFKKGKFCDKHCMLCFCLPLGGEKMGEVLFCLLVLHSGV